MLITWDLIVLWTFVGVLLGLTHWLPWPERLPRLASYSVGTLCLNVPLTWWLVVYEYDLKIVLAQWGCIAIGGVFVFFAYGYDALLNNYRRRQAAEKQLDERTK